MVFIKNEFMDKETRDKFTQIEIDRGIDDGISKWLRTVCISATTATFGFFMWLGNEVYDKFPRFKAAFIAFFSSDGGIK